MLGTSGFTYKIAVQMEGFQSINNALSGINSLEKSLKSLQNSFNGVNTQLQKSTSGLSNMGNSMLGLGRSMGLVFGAQQVLEFGKSVVNTTAEFQKFQAVLSTTLGSDIEAFKVMEEIKAFAAKTPFEVADVTSAFIKMANTGLKPTILDIKAIGDLAAVGGSNIERVAEGLKDLKAGRSQTLENALGGLNIAKLKGDWVSVDWKGQSIKVRDDFEAIQKVVMGFSKMDGVQGMMDKISATTGGKLSNLADSFTNLKASMGMSFKPLIDNGLSNLTEGLNWVNKWFVDNKPLVDGWVNKVSSVFSGVGTLVSENISKWGSVFEKHKGTVTWLINGFSEMAKTFGNGFVVGYRILNNVSRLLLGDIFHGIEYLKSGFDWVSGNILSMTNNLNQFFLNMQNGISNIFPDFMGQFSGIKNGLDNYFINPLSEYINKIASFFRLDKVFEGVFEPLTEKITDISLKNDPFSINTYSRVERYETPPNAKKGIDEITGGGRQQKNITINLGKLIENQTISTINIKEGVDKIKELVEEALLQVMNTANQAQ